MKITNQAYYHRITIFKNLLNLTNSMEKPIIQKKDGKLKYLCNEAFFGVKGILPKKIRELDDKFLAFSFGLAAGYGVAEAGESLINFLNSQGANLPLEKIVSHSLIATLSPPGIAYVIAPNYLKNFIKENPVYSLGVVGVMTGASLKAILALY